MDRLALFVDGENFSATLRALNAEIDYRKFLRMLGDRGNLVQARYYALCQPDAYDALRPLLDWLTYNGFTVIEKMRRDRPNRQSNIEQNGSIAIDLACDVLNTAPHVNRMVLCTGDAQYRALVKSVQQRGVQVLALSSTRSRPSMMADAPRRQVDDFIELADILPQVAMVCR